MKSVFLFHRDLRLEDNSALNLAAVEGVCVIPLFVLDDVQIDPCENEYFSHPSVQFMSECMHDLDDALRRRGTRLIIARGSTVNILTSVLSVTKFDRLYCNRDYTVFARQRDARIRSWCESHNVQYIDSEDYDIVPASRLLLQKDPLSIPRPYTVLSHYFNRFLKEVYSDKSLVRAAETQPIVFAALESVYPFEVSLVSLANLYHHNPHAVERGGRKLGLEALGRISSLFRRYPVDRHLPALSDGTTHLSAHLKFGSVSIREFFWEVARVANNNMNNELTREILFRSFYIKIWSNDAALQKGSSIQQKIDDSIPWNSPKEAPEYWEAWVSGKTGFPLADAGMRQLMKENYVHGRARMVTATVATRYLLLDWRDCMKHFGKFLSDYDPIANAAGWGFGSSLGENAQNIWRAPMNPFLQSKNYDPDCEYIKRWLPELTHVPAADIHNWSDKMAKKHAAITRYPAPIIDQKIASNRATTLWKNAAKKLD